MKAYELMNELMEMPACDGNLRQCLFNIQEVTTDGEGYVNLDGWEAPPC